MLPYRSYDDDRRESVTFWVGFWVGFLAAASASLLMSIFL